MPQYLYDGVYPILRTLLVGSLAYLGLVILLRISGKRTVSKWNSFDMVITVAIGSSFATALLSKDVSLTQGLAGFGLLVLLQFVITWLSIRSPAVEKVAKAEPTVLLYRGEIRKEALVRERVTEAELLAALRSKGLADLAEAAAVILETDGTFSIIANGQNGPMDPHTPGSTLRNLDVSPGSRRTKPS